MPITHTKEFGIYHWDTFDNETFLVGEANNLSKALKFVRDRYGNRIRKSGADRVEIVNSQGIIIEKYQVE